MSIKKLFDSLDKNLTYQDYKTEKEAFESVESRENASQLLTKKDTFNPAIDYTNPENFAFFGSAELYYSGSFEKISGYYPYDGSDAEKNEFYNSLLEIDKYIFDKLYPRSTGYGIISSDSWGSLVGSKVNGYGLSDSLEYITFKGGPNTGSAGSSLVNQSPNPYSDAFSYGNIYDTNIYETAGLPNDYGKGTRLSNLRANLDDGVTVEFWLKSGSLDAANTEKQVIFDLWNNEVSGSGAGVVNNDYSRITILLDSAQANPFTFVVQSGSNSKSTTIGSSAMASVNTWQHYAIVFYNTGSTFTAKLYTNGTLNDTWSQAGTVAELNSKNMMGRLGALITSPSGSDAAAGAGKLSGSIDEFRFWKTARNAQQIGENWFDQVGGGANSDLSNTTLGIYYKFNEGITGQSSVDGIVLDYAGRVSNGVWTGYSATSRNTGSAILSASAATKEEGDPIIRTSNTLYTTLRNSLLSSGSYHDINNTTMFMNYAPEWVLSEHENMGNDNLKIISHIVGAYFDKLYVLSQQIPQLRHHNYTTSSGEPISFAQHLPQSLGLYSPDIFIDATILEALEDRDKDSFFEGSLQDTRNQIYQNLYNNLANIFKAKGTEKAIRNVLRCFNLDDSLIRFHTYAKNTTYEVANNLRQTISEDKYLNFNNKNNGGGVTYQRINPTNSETIGFISGSLTNNYEKPYGFTAESNILFPKYFNLVDPITRDYLTSSLFGVCGVDQTDLDSLSGSNTTWLTNDAANFQVYAIRPSKNSKDVRFMVTSSGGCFAQALTSSTFPGVYADNKWNLSVRLKPTGYPIAGISSGSAAYTYDLIFRGTNSYLGQVQNSFEVSASVTNSIGAGFLTTPKRSYVGARRTNVTGALAYKSDVLFSDFKYWLKYLENSTLDHHSSDFNNSGISSSYENISGLDSSNNNLDILNRNMLTLEWTFSDVTGSDSSGEFYVLDHSSGSNLIRSNLGWVGSNSGWQHSGYSQNYATSSTTVALSRRINNYTTLTPEEAAKSNAIRALSEDDTLYDIVETVPNFVFTFEKSMYQAISEEMMDYMAGVSDFNNILGEPVNRYRTRYKNLEKLREAFFRRVSDIKTVEKFLGYYKWFDAGLSQILSQLMPASADFVPELYNVVESHVLERPKYETKFPTLESNAAAPNSSATGWAEQNYPGSLGGSTLPKSPRDTTRHIPFWKKRALRDSIEITSGDATIDSQREIYRKVINSVPHLSSSDPILSNLSNTRYDYERYGTLAFGKTYNIDIQNPEQTVIKGGVNFEDSKNIDYTYTALRPAGPVNQDGGVFVPVNVLLSFVEDFVKIPVNNDPPKEPAKKVKRTVKVIHGRDYEHGIGYKNVKSTMAFPFTLVSASVRGGYSDKIDERLVGQIEITNLHNDVYGPDMEKPMQGPFTDYAVGGHQSRHIAVNSGPTLDTYLTRPEAWKILLGTCTVPNGAIGMVGPDYPWPEANAEGATPYPMTGAQKAYLYRDFIAKRPVNIRNIHHRTGSTVLGNYNHQYEIVMTNGAFSNPRHFVDQQPSLPPQVFQNNTTGATSVRTFLNLRRATDDHFEWVSEYSISYLTGANNQSVIRGTFAAPGGMDTMTYGYQDFRGAEYSVYNALPYRNLRVLGHSQPPNVSQSNPIGYTPVQSRIYDIHGKEYGLRPLLARHAARFFRDSLFVTNPGASYDQLPAFHRTHRNTLTRLTMSTETTYATGAVYDNAFVSHQIPRSSQQYAWITGNVLADNTIYGFTPPDFYISDSAGYREAYTWGQSGSFGSYIIAEGRKYGKDKKSTYGSFDGFLTNPFTALNINILQPITESTNMRGFPTANGLLDYVNTSFAGVASAQMNQIKTSMLNSILLARNGPYGYAMWQQLRNGENQILALEKKDNIISIASDDRQSITRYDMPPVSTRGRPIYINIDTMTGPNEVQNVTFKAAYNNEGIYFNTNALNNRFNIDLNGYTTAFDQLVKISKKPNYSLNWIWYSENIFPSQRNEFLSRTSTRTGYNNDFWRTSRANRSKTAQTNTWNMVSLAGNPVATSSMFPLDAPLDFMTRIAAPDFATFDSTSTVWRSRILKSSSGGELQNSYTVFATSSFFSGSDQPGHDAEWKPANAVGAYGIGALYARQHTINSPWSVVSRCGIVVSETGSFASTVDESWTYLLSQSAAIQIFGGEAAWQAPALAGIVQVQNKTASFVSHPSEPWFDTYNQFRFELKTMFKDYGIVPEFRISEHIVDFLKGGILNPAKTDNFEIVGTGKNSTSASFYRDYSNTEFLQNFVKINQKSTLNPKEIRLVCSAAIRFNPYKGFYPAQRTLELVDTFVDSYKDNIAIALADGQPRPVNSKNGNYSVVRNLANALTSPGILYNTIKSGIAVDYPLQTQYNIMSGAFFGASDPYSKDSRFLRPRWRGGNWAMVTNFSASRSQADAEATGLQTDGASAWPTRLPFEAIITPENYLKETNLYDNSPEISCSLTQGPFGYRQDQPGPTAVMMGAPASDNYQRISRNFFGGVADFFLKDSSFTKLESGIVPDDLRFTGDEVYMARVKIRRSMTGSRVYSYEKGNPVSWLLNGFFGIGGGRPFYQRLCDERPLTDRGATFGFPQDNSVFYPLPQDPHRLNNDESAVAEGLSCRETFTMYSRPSAFGPPIAGCSPLPLGTENLTYTASVNPAKTNVYQVATIYDAFTGYNPAYTPPYYDGEAWADLIFRPSVSGTYDLERIMSEIKVKYWRFDAGPQISGSTASPTSLKHTFIFDQRISGSGYYSTTSLTASAAPYSARTINVNSMQLSASVDLFGIERVQFTETDKFGDKQSRRNTTTGKKWVIQPKFETPMMNFNDRPSGIRPLSSSMIDMPQFASASVPRGMWHQFGVLPEDPSTGVFLEIGDIPTEWLRYHYEVINLPSDYNDQSDDYTVKENLYKSVKSLSNLMGFDKGVSKQRLGELKDSLTVKEAIVAVPYILSEVSTPGSTTTSTTAKSFISIPQERVNAVLTLLKGTAEGDSLDTAGLSIREQIEKMQNYVLPPEFNFLDNSAIEPMVMYLFEFSYTFDRDDLSYMWQNLAPRNYKKITTQAASVTHTLANNELLSQKNILDNPNLRWMVFKVKQKSQANYYDLVATQRSQASKELFKPSKNDNPEITIATKNDDYLQYNWPYDYLSFVELIKMDAEVLFNTDALDDEGKQTFKDSTNLTVGNTQQVVQEDRSGRQLSNPTQNTLQAMTPDKIKR